MADENDLRFKEGFFHFDVRAAGVLYNPASDEVLVGVKKKDKNKQVLFGGAVKRYESTEQAVIREFKEEVGIDVQVVRLLSVIEQVFQVPEKEEKYQQILFVYLLEAEDYSVSVLEKQSTVVPKWVSRQEVKNIQPETINQLINGLPEEINHTLIF